MTMTRDAFRELVERRDAARRAYNERRVARDLSKVRAKAALRALRAERRRVADRVAELQTQIDELSSSTDDLAAAHRVEVDARDEHAAVCQEAWLEYRALDLQIPTARAEMLGL